MTEPNRSSLGHLARRFATSLSRRPPSADDDAWVGSQLGAGELALWASMPVADRRHSIEVARRLVASRPSAVRDEVAAALLHDVGKVRSGLGTFGRVVATVAGPRTRRFRLYHDHEAMGAELAAAAGSSALTIALIGGGGPPDAASALQAADDSI
ncbi:HD domain-containing protein [Desertimonas flava]|uniref:HD domain-containing protein n=1 Tax=Desertimonas flava TaxID=2064846 RepID=UPI000E34F35B|nr:HD domain-containing protein [Desertimonas flava]